MSREAEAEWDAAVKGLNIITPDRIEIGYTNDGNIYELTSGSGMDHQMMYAITILVDGKIDTSLSNLFNEGSETRRWHEAAQFVARLTGTRA